MGQSWYCPPGSRYLAGALSTIGSAVFVVRRVFEYADQQDGVRRRAVSAVCVAGGRPLSQLASFREVDAPTNRVLCSADGGDTWRDAAPLPFNATGMSHAAVPVQAPSLAGDNTTFTDHAHLLLGGWRNTADPRYRSATLVARFNGSAESPPWLPTGWDRLPMPSEDFQMQRGKPTALWLPVTRRLLVSGGAVLMRKSLLPDLSSGADGVLVEEWVARDAAGMEAADSVVALPGWLVETQATTFLDPDLGAPVQDVMPMDDAVLLEVQSLLQAGTGGGGGGAYPTVRSIARVERLRQPAVKLGPVDPSSLLAMAVGVSSATAARGASDALLLVGPGGETWVAAGLSAPSLLGALLGPGPPGAVDPTSGLPITDVDSSNFYLYGLAQNNYVHGQRAGSNLGSFQTVLRPTAPLSVPAVASIGQHLLQHAGELGDTEDDDGRLTAWGKPDAVNGSTASSVLLIGADENGQLWRGSFASCQTTSACPARYVTARCRYSPYEGVCRPCTTCPAGFYSAGKCGGFIDNTCSSCNPCGEGHRLLAQCPVAGAEDRSSPLCQLHARDPQLPPGSQSALLRALTTIIAGVALALVFGLAPACVRCKGGSAGASSPAVVVDLAPEAPSMASGSHAGSPGERRADRVARAVSAKTPPRAPGSSAQGEPLTPRLPRRSHAAWARDVCVAGSALASVAVLSTLAQTILRRPTGGLAVFTVFRAPPPSFGSINLPTPLDPVPVTETQLLQDERDAAFAAVFFLLLAPVMHCALVAWEWLGRPLMQEGASAALSSKAAAGGGRGAAGGEAPVQIAQTLGVRGAAAPTDEPVTAAPPKLWRRHCTCTGAEVAAVLRSACESAACALFLPLCVLRPRFLVSRGAPFRVGGTGSGSGAESDMVASRTRLLARWMTQATLVLLDAPLLLVCAAFAHLALTVPVVQPMTGAVAFGPDNSLQVALGFTLSLIALGCQLLLVCDSLAFLGACGRVEEQPWFQRCIGPASEDSELDGDDEGRAGHRGEWQRGGSSGAGGFPSGHEDGEGGLVVRPSPLSLPAAAAAAAAAALGGASVASWSGSVTPQLSPLEGSPVAGFSPLDRLARQPSSSKLLGASSMSTMSGEPSGASPALGPGGSIGRPAGASAGAGGGMASASAAYTQAKALWGVARSVEGRRLAAMRTFFQRNPALLPGALDAVRAEVLPPQWLQLLQDLEAQRSPRLELLLPQGAAGAPGRAASPPDRNGSRGRGEPQPVPGFGCGGSASIRVE